MRKAKIFGEDFVSLVDAIDIKEGRVSKNHQFVDPEYEFKVIYVNGAKNNGAPHFRLYLSREDYLKLSIEKKNKYDILRNMNHYAESEWHKCWSERVSHFMKIEKYLEGPDNNYKRADAFYEDGKIILEFQHSYIANDFDKRNDFYSNLGYNTIWLFDLTKSIVNENGKYVEILEDNAKGFFKVAEECQNLLNYPVFIHVKNNMIYRVEKLERKNIEGNLKSTIRYFLLKEKFTIEQFIEGIKNKDNCFYNNKSHINVIDKGIKTLFEIYKESNSKGLNSIIIKRITDNEVVKVYKDFDTGMLLETENGKIKCRYCKLNPNSGNYNIASTKYYGIKKYDAYLPIWKKIYDEKTI